MLGKLRQQGGAIVLTVPNAIIAQMGWQAGHTLEIQTQGEKVVLTAEKRQPRGRKSLAQLLEEIDSEEIRSLNASLAEFEMSKPQGKEIW